MKTRFLDMEDGTDPLNGQWINEPHELEAILDNLRTREPFALKLDRENGAILNVCLASTFGSVQYTATSEAYLLAVKPGSDPLATTSNTSPHTLAFLADEKNGFEIPRVPSWRDTYSGSDSIHFAV